MELFSKIIIEFVTNEPLEIVVIGTIAYIIVGHFMRFANSNFDIWFGREGGKFIWLITALIINVLYHCVKKIFI